MLFLGILKEVNNVRFKLASSEALAPASVQLVATDSLGFAEEVPMTPAEDDRHFEGVWNTESRALGEAIAEAQAEDLSGNLGVASGSLTLISSYGRRYGQEYGNGL